MKSIFTGKSVVSKEDYLWLQEQAKNDEQNYKNYITAICNIISEKILKGTIPPEGIDTDISNLRVDVMWMPKDFPEEFCYEKRDRMPLQKKDVDFIKKVLNDLKKLFEEAGWNVICYYKSFRILIRL